MDTFFNEISDDEYWAYEHFQYIDEQGIALDDSLNEFRDESLCPDVTGTCLNRKLRSNCRMFDTNLIGD
jgi:hypothetical protein